MSAMFAGWVPAGSTIHIGPHDVTYGDHTRPPRHLDTPEADVQVDGRPEIFGHVAVIRWTSATGRPCGSVVYDSNDLIEVTP